ncbi:hypothetical protein O0544_14245 [Edwardsiella anguillarum]|nr:hypothetical protein [Edwardsiella anguillarum]
MRHGQRRIVLCQRHIIVCQRLGGDSALRQPTVIAGQRICRKEGAAVQRLRADR